MASHKNQHFVPRCYLKPFSLEGEGRALNLFNIDKGLGIKNAPTTGQCSHNYFYGEDLRLEKLLANSEGLYAEVLRAVQTPSYALTDEHISVLRHFVYLQYCRTEAMSRRQEMFVSQMTGAAFGQVPPAEYQLNLKDTVRMALSLFGETANAIHDLKVRLVRNTTSLNYLCSDNPSILTNRWHIQNSKAKGMGTGIGNAGAIFILPMTPQILCVIYDGGVYTSANSAGWIRCDRDSDVRALNEHQFLNCWANIYFSDWAMLDDVKTAFTDARQRRPVARHVTVTAVLDKKEKGWSRYKVASIEEARNAEEGIIHVREVTPQPSRWPSFLKFRSDPQIYSNGTGTGFVRRAGIVGGLHPGTGYKRVK